MDFIYAEELKKLFNVTGSFYELSINRKVNKCRNKLAITSNDYIEGKPPDIIAVLMNPGNGHPINTDYVEPVYNSKSIDGLNKQELVATMPDATQYQVMRLMVTQGWKYALVINLSDLRNGNSTEFAKTFNTMSSRHVDSLFSSTRFNEFNTILDNYSNGSVLVGWGSLPCQYELMAKAILRLKDYKLVGVKAAKGNNCYAHPSPLLQSRKLKWLDDITALF